MSQSFSCQFRLDKAYLTECYEESVVPAPVLQRYIKSIALSAVGGYMVMATEIEGYIAWFILLLGLVDALSVFYQKGWWVTRQMLGKSANSEVTLTINDSTIKTESSVINSEILWQDVTDLVRTDRGWMLHHKGGRDYISSRFLSDEAIAFLSDKKF